MVLTPKQKDDLNRGILTYFKDHGHSAAYEAFATESGVDLSTETKQPPRLLEKKWTSIVRLQRKVLVLEQENKALKGMREKWELNRGGGAAPSAEDLATMMPRLPSRHTLQGHTKAITCVRFHQTRTILATTGDDASIRLWDYESGRFDRSLKGHTDAVQDLCFSPGGDLLASCSSDMSIRLYDLDTYNCLKTLQGHAHTVSSLSFNPEGDKLFACDREGVIKKWDINTGYCLQTVQAHEKWARCVKVSPDGTIFASCSDDQTIKLFNMSSGKCERTLLGHSHVVQCIAFSNAATDAFISNLGKDESKDTSKSNGTDSRTSASSSSNAGDAGASSSLGSIQRPGDADAVGGKYLVSSSRDKEIRVWDVASGECIYVLEGHGDWVQSVLFHPGGRFIVSGSDDKTIRCWDLQRNGKCVHMLEDAHDMFVVTLDWNPLTPLLASGCVDYGVKIWECS